MKHVGLYACEWADLWIERQICELQHYAKEHSYSVLEGSVFLDSGFDGDGLARPGLDRLRDRAAEGAFEALLILSPDCLSRRYIHQVLILEELAGYGVEVIFVNRSIGRTKEGELLLRMQSMIAEYEEAKTMERDRRMRLRKVRSGRAGAPSEAPYGFCRAEKVGGRQARYEVVEAEAEVVREIFRLLVDERYSVGQIARHLAGRKIPARGGKMWDRSAVWGILKNPIYTGRACFHGTEVVEGEKVTNQVWDRSGYPERLEPSYKDHLHEGCMEAEAPAIVSREIFQVAQAELDVNRRVVQRDNYRHLHLPRDVVVCRKCGYVTHGKPGWFISGSDSN